jgi:hypothetical protein
LGYAVSPLTAFITELEKKIHGSSADSTKIG